MNKKILVTGGTGFLGSEITRTLVNQGHSVRILDNHSRGKLDSLIDIKDDIEIITSDIRDKDVVKKSMKGVEIVCHLAYVNGTKNFYAFPYEILDIGIKGMMNIIDGLDEENLQEIILASTSETYASPDLIPTPEEIELKIPDVFNPRYSYSGGKIISELLLVNFCRKKDLSFKIFRPHNIYGPNMGKDHVIPELINKIQNRISNEIYIEGTGEETRAFCHVTDFIQAFNLVFNHGRDNEIFNIGTNEEVSINQLCNLLNIVLESDLKFIPSELRTGSPNRRCPDITKITQLGFKQKIKLVDGIRSLLT